MAVERRTICVQKSHWHVQSASSVTTIPPRIRRLILTEWKPRSIVDSVRDIQIIRKPNNFVLEERTNARAISWQIGENNGRFRRKEGRKEV